MKRYGHLFGPDGRPLPKAALRPVVEDVHQVASEIGALISQLGARVPPETAGQVNMLVELASRNVRGRGDRLRQALELLRSVPR